MANKTRTNIKDQVKKYFPTAGNTAHDTLLDNLIDLAVETISERHNFRCLAATAPASHDVTEGEYYIDEADFTFTNFKEITRMQWVKAATGEHGRIKYKHPGAFDRDYPYLDYAGRTGGKPQFYTQKGTRYFFNCPLDETVSVRAWYQMKHGNFASDDAVHLFDSDNLAFQAIVSITLSELHDALPGFELSPKAQFAIQKSGVWVSQLIESDRGRTDEEIVLGAYEDRNPSGGDNDPYSWVD